MTAHAEEERVVYVSISLCQLMFPNKDLGLRSICVFMVDYTRGRHGYISSGNNTIPGGPEEHLCIYG